MRKLIIMICVLFLIIPLVFSTTESDEYGFSGGSQETADDPTPTELAQSGDFSNIQNFNDIDWSQVPKDKQANVPRNRVKDVPKEHVDVTQVDQKGLGYDQVAYGDNYNKIQDKSKLDPKVLSEFQTNKYKHFIVPNTNNVPTTGDSGDDWFTFDNIHSISVDKTFISNGMNFRFDKGVITIDHADSIVIEETYSYNVNDAIINVSEFVIGSADEVKVHCNTFYDVTNSRFIISQNTVKVEPGATLDILDCNMADTEFEGDRITISETNPTTYNLEQGTLKFQNESIDSNTTAEVTVDPNTGFICMNITPPGTYYKTYEDIRKDFAIHIYQEPYKLCFEKTGYDGMAIPTNELNYGLIDFVEQILYLNGKAQYLRYPFADNITEVNFRNIYDGKKSNTKAVVNLDNNALYASSIDVEYNEGTTSVSNPAEYITITEEDTTSWVSLSHKHIKSDNIAISYKTSALTLNILTEGRHTIYPYNSQILKDYIDSLNEEEGSLLR